jgi:putative selenate reductase
LTAPLEIKEENDKLKLTCCKMKLSGKDKSGRAAPERIPDLELKIEFDKILPAIGQEVASEFLGSLKVNTETCETQFKNVYLGGDALRGSSTLIKAIADGKNISQNILNKVRGNVTTKNETTSKNNTPDDFQIKNATRIFGEKIIETHVFERNSFELVTKSLTQESAQKESARCLFCDVYCNTCVTVCPNRAFISYTVKPNRYKSKKIIVSSKNLLFKEDFEFEIKQEYQVLNINDFCNECGNCTTFCPTNGAPYKNKPRLYLNKNDFQYCREGYFCGIVSNKKFIEYKSGIKTERIVNEPNCFEYQHDDYEIRLDLKDLRIIKTKIFKTMECEISLRNAVKMCILLKYLPEYLFLK